MPLRSIYTTQALSRCLFPNILGVTSNFTLGQWNLFGQRSTEGVEESHIYLMKAKRLVFYICSEVVSGR